MTNYFVYDIKNDKFVCDEEMFLSKKNINAAGRVSGCDNSLFNFAN